MAGTTWQCITCPADAGSGGSGSVDLGAVMAFVGAAVAVVFVILGIARVCIRRKFTGGSSTSRAKVGSTVSSQSSAVAIPIVHPVLTADEAAALMARSKAAAKMSKAAELLKAWELSPLERSSAGGLSQQLAAALRGRSLGRHLTAVIESTYNDDFLAQWRQRPCCEHLARHVQCRAIARSPPTAWAREGLSPRRKLTTCPAGNRSYLSSRCRLLRWRRVAETSDADGPT
jgi:hypothetical protein